MTGSNDNHPPRTSKLPHKPGQVHSVSCSLPEGNEFVVKHPDGTEIRVNLTVGNRLQITVGAAPYDLSIYSFNPELVGIPRGDL